jgi:ribosomal protein L29
MSDKLTELRNELISAAVTCCGNIIKSIPAADWEGMLNDSTRELARLSADEHLDGVDNGDKIAELRRRVTMLQAFVEVREAIS